MSPARDFAMRAVLGFVLALAVWATLVGTDWLLSLDGVR